MICWRGEEKGVARLQGETNHGEDCRQGRSSVCLAIAVARFIDEKLESAAQLAATLTHDSQNMNQTRIDYSIQ